MYNRSLDIVAGNQAANFHRCINVVWPDIFKLATMP